MESYQIICDISKDLLLFNILYSTRQFYEF